MAVIGDSDEVIGMSWDDEWNRLTANASAAAALLVTRNRAMRRHYRRALF